MCLMSSFCVILVNDYVTPKQRMICSLNTLQVLGCPHPPSSWPKICSGSVMSLDNYGIITSVQHTIMKAIPRTS